MKRKNEKQRIPVSGTSTPTTSMADMFQQAGVAPIAPSQTERPSTDMPHEETPAAASETPFDLRRVRIRIERKHRGGKTVTLIEGIDLPPDARTTLLKQLKTALGCGGIIEGETLVLQGDIVERARKWIASNAV